MLVVLLFFLSCHQKKEEIAYPKEKTQKNNQQDTEQDNNSVVNSLQEQFSKFLDQVYSKQKPLSEKAQKEIEKLFTFQYKIVEYSDSLSAAELEKKLNKLGKERWDCFYVSHIKKNNQGKIRIFCKRKPKTYLRYVPRVF